MVCVDSSVDSFMVAPSGTVAPPSVRLGVGPLECDRGSRSNRSPFDARMRPRSTRGGLHQGPPFLPLTRSRAGGCACRPGPCRSSRFLCRSPADARDPLIRVRCRLVRLGQGRPPDPAPPIHPLRTDPKESFMLTASSSPRARGGSGVLAVLFALAPLFTAAPVAGAADQAAAPPDTSKPLMFLK